MVDVTAFPGGSRSSTSRERIYAFIVDYIERVGYPPSVREIGKGVGLSSSATVHVHLRTLAAEGWLRVDSVPRGIVVLQRKEASDGPEA